MFLLWFLFRGMMVSVKQMYSDGLEKHMSPLLIGFNPERFWACSQWRTGECLSEGSMTGLNLLLYQKAMLSSAEEQSRPSSVTLVLGANHALISTWNWCCGLSATSFRKQAQAPNGSPIGPCQPRRPPVFQMLDPRIVFH